MAIPYEYYNDFEKITIDDDNCVMFDGQPLRIQTPRFYIPFGVRTYDREYSTTGVLDLSIRGHDEENSASSKFVEWYRKFEERLHEISGNTENFNSCIKHPNPQFAPLFRTKMPLEDGQIGCNIWKQHEKNSQKVYGKVDGLFKGNTAFAIMIPKFYEISNGMWGVSWTLDQLRLFETKRIKGCLL